MKTLYDLMLAAAKHLTGIDVELQFSEKKSLRAAGCVRVNPAGRVVIDLASDYAPAASEDDLRVFLHEVAHAKLHAKGFGRSDTDRAPIWDKPKSKQQAGRRLLMESQADTLAHAWNNWAAKRAPEPWQNGRSVFENRLTALLRY